MTRFEEVARLTELEQKATPAPWNLDMQFDPQDVLRNVKLEIALRNAAPWLLEVAGCFQPGYAALLKEIVWAMDTYFQDSHYRPHKIAMGELVKAAEIVEGQE
jgi:hypothetical protein